MQQSLFEPAQIPEPLKPILAKATEEKRGAMFSQDRRYRYSLHRIWDESLPLVMFIGLNPSTANDSTDDPTIESVRRISMHNGYGGFYMMNLYGIISEDPKVLQRVSDPMGKNMGYHDIVKKLCRDVVFAWGNFKEATEPAKEFIARYPEALCIGKNKNGSPVHPLYQKSDSVLTKY